MKKKEQNLPREFLKFLGPGFLVTIGFIDHGNWATNIAGGAIGFNLLLDLPLWVGALLTVILEVFFIVSQRYHRLEKIILGLLGVITICFIIELFIVKPDWLELGPALAIPRVTRGNIYIAMGMPGAVVMPHNIFLHSNVIQSRKWGATEEEKKRLIRFDSDRRQQVLIIAPISAMMLLGAIVDRESKSRNATAMRRQEDAHRPNLDRDPTNVFSLLVRRLRRVPPLELRVTRVASEVFPHDFPSSHKPTLLL